VTGTIAGLQESVRTAANAYYRLVLVVSPAGGGKSTLLRSFAAEHDLRVISLGRALGERLLELTRKQRSVRTSEVVQQLLDATEQDVVLLDNIELLFTPDLGVDPLRLLRAASRNRTIVAAWPGSFDSDTLSYAEPGHPEWRRYERPGVLIIHPGGHTAPDPSPAACS
jgi:hypothetical protein